MNVLERIISIYAPHSCVGCGVVGSILCTSCHDVLPVPEPCCYRCKAPSLRGQTCLACRSETCLVSVNSATQYAAVAKNLVWSLKFDRAQAAADSIGRLLAERYSNNVTEDMLVVPIPTATSRVRKRGYDQAVLIAKSFARHTDCSYASLLVRHGSQEQIGASRRQRHDQLQGAFSVKGQAAIQGSRIILIDDVLTTGATAEEAAKLLKSAGARAVGALTFVRA